MWRPSVGRHLHCLCWQLAADWRALWCFLCQYIANKGRGCTPVHYVHVVGVGSMQGRLGSRAASLQCPSLTLVSGTLSLAGTWTAAMRWEHTHSCACGSVSFTAHANHVCSTELVDLHVEGPALYMCRVAAHVFQSTHLSALLACCATHICTFACAPRAWCLAVEERAHAMDDIINMYVVTNMVLQAAQGEVGGVAGVSSIAGVEEIPPRTLAAVTTPHSLTALLLISKPVYRTAMRMQVSSAHGTGSCTCSCCAALCCAACGCQDCTAAAFIVHSGTWMLGPSVPFACTHRT